MSAAKTPKSSSHTRRVDAYLQPANHSFVSNLVSLKGLTKSEVMNEAVRALREKHNATFVNK